MGRKYQKSLLESHPDLAEQWSARNSVLPQDVTQGSNKKVWWTCPKGHEWEAVIASRAGKSKSGCAYCNGKKVDYANSVGHLFPELAKQWHKCKNVLSCYEVAGKSDKKVWWICPKGHEWEAVVKNRTVHGRGCPFCGKTKADKETSLLAQYPELCQEWDESRNDFGPDVVRSQSNRQVWWQCRKNKEHRWVASIANRSKRKSGCPYCKGSSGEKLIRDVLDSLNVNFSQNYRFPGCRLERTLPFDFAVHSSKLGVIEFQGEQHYKPVNLFGGKEKFHIQEARDLVKRSYCLQEGVPLLEIRFDQVDQIAELLKSFVEGLK